jgi:two-component system NtrC family sensor kinase
MKFNVPSLNLSSKILIILSCYVFGILAIFLVSQDDLHIAKEKLEVVELAYSLHSIILEVRRYEKNFLLYGTKEALHENIKHLALALETVATVSERVAKFKVHPMLIRLKNLTLAYQMGMELLSTKSITNKKAAHGELADELRYQGQEMTELSKELVSFEHNQIRIILDELVTRLILWSLVAIGVGIFVPLVMSFRIFKPLRIIKSATEDIALGRFSKIEVVGTRDEMQQVMEAFNIMVHELERRQDQLVESQKLSSIGTLTAGVAHQLNNPLNNISTSCQIALDDFDSGEPALIKKMLRNIEQETFRARDVVQGLLEFSRVKEFELHPADLQNVVNRSVRLVKSQVPSAISILVDIPINLFLPMDVQRIQEVLIIMIINASQAIVGEGKISISAFSDRDLNEAVIKITDTGMGIASEIKDRIFDPFYTTKDEGQGTGLGLSIAYGIIQKHNGKIVVESVAESGASFFIHLPQKRRGDRPQEKERDKDHGALSWIGVG